MGINVSINPLTKAKYFDEVLIKYPSLESNIIKDFTRYKELDELPDYFGCDVAYTEPHAAIKSGLMHIHIKLLPDTFPINKPQADRKCAINDPENDACLVYVQGELYEDRYSLIAILNPDAHALARDRQVMNYLCQIAQDFKDEN